MCATRVPSEASFFTKRESNQNLSGNDVYNTKSLIFLVKNMLFSKLDCQKGFNLIIFPYKIPTGGDFGSFKVTLPYTFASSLLSSRWFR